MEVRIRISNHPTDIEFAVAQTQREGWDTTRELFELCRRHDRDGFLIAEADGERIGMVTALKLQSTGWIGNLIVTPLFQRRGIGWSLFAQAMVYLRHPDVTAIRLEADPPGERLYRRFGFIDEFESLRFRREHGGEMPRQDAIPMRKEHLRAVAAFDAERFGDGRARSLRLFFRYAKRAYLLRDGGDVCGYAMAWPSAFGVRIGPCVAQNAEAAERLFRSVLADYQNITAVVGVPRPNEGALRMLESLGFVRTPSCRRMWWGEHVRCGDPATIFAIGSGATG